MNVEVFSENLKKLPIETRLQTTSDFQRLFNIYLEAAFKCVSNKTTTKLLAFDGDRKIWGWFSHNRSEADGIDVRKIDRLHAFLLLPAKSDPVRRM